MQLSEKYQPRKLEDFIGMDSVKRRLRRFLDEPYSSAWMLVGDPGIGKTTMALSVAEELGGQLYKIPSRACNLEMVDEVAAKCHYRPMLGDWNVVLIDEVNHTTQPAQLAMLSKLDATAAPPHTIWLFTANDTRLLEGRFLSRCHVLKFSIESAKEQVVEFLARVYRKEKGKLKPAPDFARLFAASDFNVRTALMNLEMILMDPESAEEILTTPLPVQPANVRSISDGRSGIDPKRSDAARRAWITIRARSAAKAQKRRRA